MLSVTQTVHVRQKVYDAAPVDRIRIGIILPYLFSVRDFLFTPVWEEMARRADADFLLMSSSPDALALIEARGVPNIRAVNRGVTGYRRLPAFKRGWAGLPMSLLATFLAKVDASYLYSSCKLRFSAVHEFSFYEIRRRSGPGARQRRMKMADYKLGERAGFPFPRSRTLLRFLYECRQSPRLPVLREDREWMSRRNLDLFVFGRLHWQYAPYWARVARRTGVPMVGIVSSWDHPTTKGCTPRGMSGYVVASQRMEEEMAGLHGIDRARIVRTGKVQMDRYMDPRFTGSREALLRKLGLPETAHLVTLGTNAPGLKEHEVSIARHLAQAFSRQDFGDAALVIRAHPQDPEWQRDFGALECPSRVIVVQSSNFKCSTLEDQQAVEADARLLAALMKYSDVVIQSRGSLALDAIAFDTPVVSLAFDGDMDLRPEDSFVREYEFEHYKPIVKAEGTWMVGSFPALDRAIKTYLADPSVHATGRARIRREQVEPLDGCASARLVDSLVESARCSRNGTIAPGDWGYHGIGNVDWAAQQDCDVEAFIDT